MHLLSHRGDAGEYAESLLELGEVFTKLSEHKENMIEDTRVSLLSPLYDMQHKHLKEISFQRKKLESRRLDYEYKKGQGEKIPEEEFEIAKVNKWNRGIFHISSLPLPSFLIN